MHRRASELGPWEPSAEQGEAPAEAIPSAVPARELGGRLAGLSLPRQVYVLAIWPLLEQVLSLTVGTVDMALAGRLEPEALAIAATDALGVTSFIGWLMNVVYGSVGVGATALIARATGGRHRGLANAALGQSLVLALFVGIAAGIVLFSGARLLGRIVGLEGLSLDLCTQYLRIVTLAAPAHALLLIGSAALRGAGETRPPFLIMLGVNLLNVAASVLFVYGPAPFGGHGLAGIAAGTMIAWLIGGIAILVYLARSTGWLRLRAHRLRPHAHTVRRIVRVGLPNLAEAAGGMWLATFLVLLIVGRLPGTGMVGSHMIAIRIESYSFQPGFALGIAAATLAGQYLGLGDPRRAKQAVMLCWIVGSVIMGLMGLLFIAIPEPLARIITHSDLLIEQAAPLIRICGIVQIPFATYIILASALRGAGDTATTMKLTYASVFSLRVPGAFLLARTAGLGLPGVWIALCIDLTVKAILFAWRFLHGGWTKVQV